MFPVLPDAQVLSIKPRVGEQKRGVIIQSPTARAFGELSEGILRAKAPSCGSEPTWQLPGASSWEFKSRLCRCFLVYGRLAVCRPCSLQTKRLASCTLTCSLTGVFQQPLPPLVWGGVEGGGGRAFAETSGTWDRPAGQSYEQMPCLSRPAPTFSLGHLEEGSLARWQRWGEGSLGPGAA